MGYRNLDRQGEAVEVAQSLVDHLFMNPAYPPRIAIVLGTGWGDALEFQDRRSVSLGKLSERFWSLGTLAGHAREVVAGKVAGTDVLALRGRIHLNEAPGDPKIFHMVRLQVEMFLALGVKTLILTNAAGSLQPKTVKVGDIVAADGFVMRGAPDMPGWAGEFASPEDTLDPVLRRGARVIGEVVGLTVHEGGYAMLRGPFFEGRKYDKPNLRETGASAVGMSTLPEACIAALYPGTKVLALSFITNDDAEEHSHEENVRRAKEQSGKLGMLLAGLIGHIRGMEVAAQ